MSFILGILLFVIGGGILDGRLPWRDLAPPRRR
jgi:hypothetical protein